MLFSGKKNSIYIHTYVGLGLVGRNRNNGPTQPQQDEHWRVNPSISINRSISRARWSLHQWREDSGIRNPPKFTDIFFFSFSDLKSLNSFNLTHMSFIEEFQASTYNPLHFSFAPISQDWLKCSNPILIIC